MFYIVGNLKIPEIPVYMYEYSYYKHYSYIVDYLLV